ncbi:MAG: TIGR03617 family F420-dependent LLM class oxidoreductase [Acidimicrobiia bacterium]
MKLDVLVVGLPFDEARRTIALADEAGFDGAWITETWNDPFLPLAAAAPATARIELGTAIALAFVRSPMITAITAWEIQRASGGRFRLGLGTQVKAHNERRYSVPFSFPAARLREQVAALRAIWDAFAGRAPLDFKGEFYRFDLLPDFFNPGPIDAPPPPVYLAAVNPYSFRAAGEVADGVHVHPLHSVEYLRDVALPAVEEGLARAGRRREDITVSAQMMVIVGRGEDRRRREADVRRQIAFYGSTRTYKAPLEHAGFDGLNAELHRLMAEGDGEGLLRAVPDELVERVAVVADTWEEAVAAARARYQGVVDRISLYSLPPLEDPAAAASIPAAFRGENS